MPIGDLLAEITGQPSAPISSLSANRTAATTGSKRKADGDSASTGIPNKAIKQSHFVSRDTVTRRPSPPPARSVVPAKATAALTDGQRLGVNTTTVSSSSNKPYTGTAATGRAIRRPEPLGTTASKKIVTESSVRAGIKSVTLGAAIAAPSKLSPTVPTSTGPVKAPKKGSFAEIMARAAKAQQVTPKAGVIQHKAIGQMVLDKKEREERQYKLKYGTAADDNRSSDLPSRGKAVTRARNGVNKDAHSTPKGNGRSGPIGKDAPEKKVKKAAMVSTGYTGTARPSVKKPMESKDAKTASSRGRPAGGLLAMPRTGRRDQYGDEGLDMDDFIDDDENEEEVAPRGYRYADEYDSESDMEANADDIYAEEQRALRQAREDDAKEEALLEKLKRDKEARKRRNGT